MIYRAFGLGLTVDYNLYSDTLCVGEFVTDWNQITDGEMYIVVTRETIVYKSVYNHLSKSNSFMLCSSTASHDPYFVNIDSVVEIWKSVASIIIGNHSNKRDSSDLNNAVVRLQRQMALLNIE